MKLEELFNDGIQTEAALARKIRSFDWMFEFNEEYDSSIKRYEMTRIENAVYEYWRHHPNRAIRIWNENCPSNLKTKSTPSFIKKRRLEAASAH
jgi:hypothetical protein